MRRMLCVTMICSLLLVVLSVTASATSDTSATLPTIPTTGDVWDGVSISEPTAKIKIGDVYYYEIRLCSELAYIAKTGGNWLNANYILADNLIFNENIMGCSSDGKLLSPVNGIKQWTAIASYLNPFNGIFLGNGNKISGLFIDSGYEIGLFAVLGDTAIVDGVTLTNCYFSGTSVIGGIVGRNSGGSIKNCSFCGWVVSSSECAGGICGISEKTSYYDNQVADCTNYGCVISKGDKVGGIIGDSSRDEVIRCTNYGSIYSTGNQVGGIIGFADLYPQISENVNYGTVYGNTNSGGICGKVEGETYLTQCVSNCYNAGVVQGVDTVGGIIGCSQVCKLINSYSLANVTGTSYVGAVVGFTDSVYGKSVESNNYYLDGCADLGRGNADDETEAVERKSETQLKEASCFPKWDFENVWSISKDLNSGYPYLAWQNASGIPLLNLLLSQDTLSLGVGDVTYLTVSSQPKTATLPQLTWESSDKSIAAVNSSGRVSAFGAGAATITVSGGGFSAECIVTVSARAPDEYRIGVLTLRDVNGAALTAIPTGQFTVTIPVVKQASNGNTVVFLAAYGSGGQYKGLLYVAVEEVPSGATVKITLPVDNTKGNIALLKAFPIASFSNPIPVGAVSCFPAQ